LVYKYFVNVFPANQDYEDFPRGKSDRDAITMGPKKRAPRVIEVEGKTSQDAIQAALTKLGVSRNMVNVKILAEGEQGLYGMSGMKLAKVRVSLKDI